MVTSWNELADLLAQIPDDDTAEEIAEALYNTKIERFQKGRWADVGKRFKDFSKLDKDEKYQVVDAVEALKEEAHAALARLAGQAGGYYHPAPKLALRNDTIRADELKQVQPGRLKKKGKYLTKCVDMVDQFMIDLPAGKGFEKVYEVGRWWIPARGSGGGPPKIPTNPNVTAPGS